ncbi:MAG TPA: S8 family serine peptidase [Solirubrobacterales bacterium]
MERGGGPGRWRLLCVALGACALLVGAVTSAAAAARDFENPASQNTSQQFSPGSVQRQDTPDDPSYDRAEPDDPDSTLNGGTVSPSTNVYDEQFGLFGFPSSRTQASARYLAGPHVGQPQVSGFNASGAWKLERGRPDVAIAILDTGIRWDNGSLRTQIHLNRGELPAPNHGRSAAISDPGSVPGGSCPNMASAYDANGDGAFNVLDYVCDSRVSVSWPDRHGPGGALTAEDLIQAFSNGMDEDHNGFVDDVAGWDFFDNDNNPYDASSYFAAANHGTGRAENAAERGNEGSGGLGVCPHCQIMPLRTWDTFVSDGNTFAMGVLYATDNGAAVIEGANGSTYHSAFAEAASQYAYDHGVVQTYSGDDLNTGNHNYPANYGHAMLIQGTVPDTIGLGEDAGNEVAQALQGLCGPVPVPVGCPGTSVPVSSYFRGANTTQYGGKSSISMEGTTGSENTGKAAGAAGIVVSAALDRAQPIELRPDEVREILEQTAERVTTPNTGAVGVPDPGADPTAASIDQWTSHFGWGRVNLGAAASLARTGKVPPEAAIDSPDWYAPLTGSSFKVGGLARARFAAGHSFHWTLQWGAGEAPTAWHTVRSGNSSQPVTDFGSIDLNQVRAALATYVPPPDTGGPTFAAGEPNPYQYEFAVRLVVNGQSIPTPGVDRRVFTSARDASLQAGYPKRMGTGGEAPIRYADVNGDNKQELIVPTEDGTIHAYRPNGSELPGWPVHTRNQISAAGHDSAPGFQALEAGGTPPREPPRGPVVADLNQDGVPEVVDTAGIHIYAWEPDGRPAPGFPVSSNLNFCGPQHESQPLVHPKCGFLASPAVGRLQGPTKPLDIVAPSLDGHLYAFDHHGKPLPGFPVALVDPGVPKSQQMIAESINEPAIAQISGDAKEEVVVATNETYGAVQDPAQGLSALLAGAAGGSSRLYAVWPGGNAHPGGPFLPGWPVKLDGAIQSTLPLIGPGQNPAIAKIGSRRTIVASTTGSASIEEFDGGGHLVETVQQAAYGPGSNATDRTGTINLFESAVLGKLVPGGRLDIVKYGLSLSDVANLLLTGQNAPYNHLIGAYDASTGTPLAAWPRITDDFQFLSASDVARVDTSSPGNQVVAGTGLGLIHAYSGTTGTDVSGFPKVTGGWLFAPAAFSNDGRMADITREGYLFQWKLPRLAKCQSEWPQFRHDPHQTGNYDADGTPPNKPTALSLKNGVIGWKAPGDDYGCGAASRYRIVTSTKPISTQGFASATPLANPPTPKWGGTAQSYRLPAHKRYVAIRAIDDAGNIGYSAQVDTRPGG